MTYPFEDIESRLRLEFKINPNGKEIQGIKPIVTDSSLVYNFNDVEAFISAFDILKSELFIKTPDGKRPKLLFRGHEDARWELTPSVFRGFNEEKNINNLRILKSGNGLHLPETKEFISFITGISNLGLSIENESFEMLDSNENTLFLSEKFDLFPTENQLKELALAQHYGVKTRLIDFTTNPMKAIFFACKNIPKYFKNEENKKLGIWIIPERLLKIVNEDESRNVKKIYVQGFQNKNMTAQEGVFINYFKGRANDSTLFNDLDKLKTLDEYLFDNTLSNNQFRLINECIGKPMLFTLPHSYIHEIHDKLESLNINWFTLQPDLEGVKKEIDRQGIINKY